MVLSQNETSCHLLKLWCWEVYVPPMQFCTEICSRKSKKYRPKRRQRRRGAAFSARPVVFPNITVVLGVSKVYINGPYPILVLTTVLDFPRRADSENVCKNGVENYH